MLNSLLHGLLMLAKYLAEKAAAVGWRAQAYQTAETAEDAGM